MLIKQFAVCSNYRVVIEQHRIIFRFSASVVKSVITLYMFRLIRSVLIKVVVVFIILCCRV